MKKIEQISYAKTVYGQEEIDAVTKCLNESGLIWKEINKQEIMYLSWVPLLYWIIVPLNSWACANNILENTMNIFVCLGQ